MSRILVIDDDEAICRTLQVHFRSLGHELRSAHVFDEGLAIARRWQPQLLILDVRLPGKDGLDGLEEIKREQPGIPVLMITAFHDMVTTVTAMKRGASDYVTKPIDIDELDRIVAHLLKGTDRSNAPESAPLIAGAKAGASVMVGRSRAMREVFKTIGMVAGSNTTVLIVGESGTGKELVARAIHHASKGPAAPFVAVSCAALVETLLESDLFGYERGAFTGAVNRQVGKFALANDGTLLLDEIGELSPNIQAKLLRVLQEREFRPLGTSELRRTNARVLAATNLELRRAVETGRFREDLFYRLQVVTICLPPLRERKEDLDDLVPALLTRIGAETRRGAKRVSPELMAAIRAYGWPGNVRELENVLTKAVVLSPHDTLTADFLPDLAAVAPGVAEPSARAPTELSLRDIEREHVERVLAATGWHRTRACEILGVSRPRLRRLIREYGIAPPKIAADPGGK
jgi:DNA-binding NtrC family response regulator